ncbi:MAG: hypothetical protein ACT4PP_03510 [Sporichthyaceae bacterium]
MSAQGASAGPALTAAALVRFPTFASLADSTALTSPVVLAGRLRDLGAKPVAGAVVLVAAWPSPQQLAALGPGGNFDVVPVARTTSGRDGSYQLRSVLTPVLAALAGKDGLDIEINVFHSGRHFVYLSQVRINPLDRSWGGALLAGTVAPALSGRTGDPNALDIALDPALGEPLNTRAHTSSWPPPTSPGEEAFDKREKLAGHGCTSYRLLDKPKRAMTTVATGVVRNGPQMAITYSSGAETTVSTGFSFDHGASFSINGSRSRSSSFTANFVPAKAKAGKVVAKEYRVQFLHYTSRRVCRGDNFDDYRVHYVTSPGRSTRGVDHIASRYPSWECLPGDPRIAPGIATSVETDKESAATYGAAFGFSPLGGSIFEGRAQSGYSELVKVLFTFADPERGKWCGNSGDPGAGGQRLMAFEVAAR